MSKFEIGQSVWYANRSSAPTQLVCPDCLGSAYIRCIIADGTEYTVDCKTCERGWMGSQGYLSTWTLTGYASVHVITGINLKDNGADPRKWLYSADGFYEVEGTEIFATKEEAEARAAEFAKEKTEAEHARLLTKEKDTKSWAWNVTYHRGQIRRAQKELEYHTSKLNVAQGKAKQDKQAQP